MTLVFSKTWSARLGSQANSSRGCPKPIFQHDVKTQHAVVRCLEVIGEAANNLSATTRAELSAIPWHDVIGQRHIAIHHYYKLDMSRIWRTVKDDLPKLLATIEGHLG